PTRVLRIDGPERVRLHISDGETGSYACLSHCWGHQSASILKTTKTTLERHQQEIPWQELPRTFRDASQFTYYLGLNYLWIDSLCIVRDFLDDWRREGSCMADIYEFAFVTLAATKAPGATSGCFTAEDGSHNTSIEFQARVPLVHDSQVFQERKLSPRIIHFTEQELGWECGASSWCECSIATNFFEKEHSLTKASLEAWNVPLVTHMEWQRTISEYTGKSLKYTKDIFPALQGLAKRFSPLLGEYYAGLCEATFIDCLTWRCAGWSGQGSRPPEWRAPTWSWPPSARRLPFLHKPASFRRPISMSSASLQN
ncbi:HET-domain-containing protein, partial [Setomelanomma holmii]